MYHMPAHHAIVLALLLSALFALGFAYWLYRTCSRTVHAEFLVLQEQRAQKQNQAAEAAPPPV
jgi:phosphate/sulfate permease